jgi:hypothetical protein
MKQLSAHVLRIHGNDTEGSTDLMTQILIPLTHTENTLRLVHDRLDADGNCAAVARVEGLLNPDLLGPGLRRLQERHPRLRCRIAGSPDGKTGTFQEAGPVDIPVEVRDVEDSASVPGIAAEACLAPFDCEGGPLFRVLLLRHAREGSCHLVTTVHHAVADGLAMARFYDDLFTSYEAAESGVAEPPVVSLPWAHPLPPGTPLSFRRRLRFAAGLASITLRNLLRRPLTLERDPTRNESFRPVLLSAEQTAALTARTRLEKNTMNSTLYAAALLAVRDLTDLPRVRVSCQNAVRLQKLATGGDVNDHVGCFVYPALCTCAVSADCSFWDLARKCRDDRKVFLQSEWSHLFRDVAFREAAGSSLFLRLLRRIKKQSPKGTLGRNTLAVSYMGTMPVRGRYGSLSWTGFFGYGKSLYMGAAVGVIGLTLQDRLSLSIVGHGVGDAVTDTFASAVERHLHAAVDGVRAEARAGVAD